MIRSTSGAAPHSCSRGEAASAQSASLSRVASRRTSGRRGSSPLPRPASRQDRRPARVPGAPVCHVQDGLSARWAAGRHPAEDVEAIAVVAHGGAYASEREVSRRSCTAPVFPLGPTFRRGRRASTVALTRSRGSRGGWCSAVPVSSRHAVRESGPASDRRYHMTAEPKVEVRGDPLGRVAALRAGVVSVRRGVRQLQSSRLEEEVTTAPSSRVAKP